MKDQIETGNQNAGERERLKLFGKRLALAVLLRGIDNTILVKRMREEGVSSKASLFNHKRGRNKPANNIVIIYERLLDLPHGWLWRQDFSSDELDEIKDALRTHASDNPLLIKIRASIPKLKSASNGVGLPINHPIKQLELTPSKTLQILYVPILPDGEVSAWLSGGRSFEMSLIKTLPIPDMPNLGPRTWAHVIAQSDFSMTGIGDRSYPPGSILIIDPDRPIIPGDRIVIRPRDVTQWLVRKYQAAWTLPADFANAKRFMLIATNPSFEPIRITKPDAWELGGRVMASYQPE